MITARQPCSLFLSSPGVATPEGSASSAFRFATRRFPPVCFSPGYVSSGVRLHAGWAACIQAPGHHRNLLGFRNGKLHRNHGQDAYRSPPVRRAYGNGRLVPSGADDDRKSEVDPPWRWALKTIYSSVKGGLEFLWDQPGQLRHIELTPLVSVMKMALLTLVVVVLLMIFLASVDSAFSYIRATILRKAP